MMPPTMILLGAQAPMIWTGPGSAISRGMDARAVRPRIKSPGSDQ